MTKLLLLLIQGAALLHPTLSFQIGSYTFTSKSQGLQNLGSYTFTSKSQGLQNLREPAVTSSSRTQNPLFSSSDPNQEPVSVYLDSTLTDDRIKSLFAWISRAFMGDPQYNNLMLAMAAIFGTNLPPDSDLLKMKQRAIDAMLPATNDSNGISSEDIPMGEAISRREREQSSLGAMGAGQWLGHYQTRPHALLDVSPNNAQNITSVETWTKTLPRGCRRTLKKANAQNFTVTTHIIQDRQPAPHSSLAHFRCVVEHEVRLIAVDENDTEGFLDALSMAVGRYVETTRMTGEIHEYRNEQNQVIAFAHEVKKGKAIRGQWFYATDEASKSYVWFHSVQELVRRACEIDGVDVADLGPSGSDAFSELKAKYGFESVVDWPAVADYTGDFWYGDEKIDDVSSGSERNRMMDLLRMLGEQQ